MKKTMRPSKEFKTYWWVNLILLIFIVLLISVDVAYGQNTGPQRQIKVNGKKVKHIERNQTASFTNSCTRLTNRTIDGTCNNIDVDEGENWGAADIALYRHMDAAYGAPDFYNDMGGNCRISARAISNIVSDQSGDILSPRGLSSFVFTWGQFIDHDITLTPEAETEYVPILLPANEPLFTVPIPFHRSEPLSGSGVTDDRQQQNLITAWLDASQVYGSETSRANWLRTFNNGKLKTSPGNLLPYNTFDGSLNTAIDPNAPSMAGDQGGLAKVFAAGDVRANEQPGLTSLHTLFVREHNRICDQFVAQSQTNDELNYQRARKRVGGLMQAITYNEFLPALGVNVAPYSGYDPNIQADVSNMFATAAYRLGHTMVTSEIPLIDTDCNPIDGGSLGLLEGFFNPTVIATYGIESFIQGLASQTQQKVDAKIVDELRNFLFGGGGGPVFGLDLGSLNIQRGRDHGLPDYNSVRAYYTSFQADEMSDITSDPALRASLETAYGSPYDIDLWVGLLSEDPLPGSSVGITLNAMLQEQFRSLRDGDFYFYRNDPAISNQLEDQINNTTLRDIVLQNTPIDHLQNNVFFAANCNPNGGGGGGGGGGNGGGHGGGGHGGGGGGPGGGGHGGGGIIGNDPSTPMLSTLNLYPNPSNGKFNLSVLFEEAANQIIVKVQDINGKEFKKETFSSDSKALYFELDLSNYSPGMYFISVQSGGELFTEKMIIE